MLNHQIENPHSKMTLPGAGGEGRTIFQKMMTCDVVRGRGDRFKLSLRNSAHISLHFLSKCFIWGLIVMTWGREGASARIFEKKRWRHFWMIPNHYAVFLLQEKPWWRPKTSQHSKTWTMNISELYYFKPLVYSQNPVGIQKRNCRNLSTFETSTFFWKLKNNRGAGETTNWFWEALSRISIIKRCGSCSWAEIRGFPLWWCSTTEQVHFAWTKWVICCRFRRLF